MLRWIRKIITFFKPTASEFYIPNDPLITQTEELKRKIMEHRYHHLFLCALLMLNNGCGDFSLWPKKVKELSHPTIQELPETEDPALLEKINGLPSISVTQDSQFKSQNLDNNFWKLDANSRSLFYSQNEVQIAKFYVENPSNENLKLRFLDVVLQGEVHQFLNRFHMETKDSSNFSDFDFRSEIYRMNKVLDLSSFLRLIVFDQKKRALSLDIPFELNAHEKLLGYVVIDFFALPRCELPQIESYKKDGWDFYTQYDLYRLEFNFSVRFRVEKSLAGASSNFYSNSNHWIMAFDLSPQTLHHTSDYMFYWKRGHNHTAQSLHDVSQEHDISEFSCNGLY